MDLIVLTAIWLIMSTTAVCAHFWAAGDAYMDIRALKKQGLNGSLKFVAKGQIWISSALGVIQILALFMGLIGIIDPPIPHYTSSDVPISIVLDTGALMLMEVIGVTVSVFVVWYRRRIRDMRARGE